MTIRQPGSGTVQRWMGKWDLRAARDGIVNEPDNQCAWVFLSYPSP